MSFESVADAFRCLLPPDVASVARADLGNSSELYPIEAEAVTRAKPQRLAEFAAGRACARAALVALGLPRGPIPRGQDRAPVWPAGTVGSITHCAGLCAAAAGLCATYAGIGIDTEVRRTVGSRLWKVASRAEEVAQLAQLPPDEAVELATVYFSAREAFFKAQFPATRMLLDHLDVRLSRVGDAAVDIELCVPVPGLGGPGSRFRGLYRLRGDHVLSSVVLLRGAAA